MKQITKIEFINYKAFYGEGENNQINIPYGKNLLIYGENGSGKSTIYEGVKQFFNSSNETVEVIPSRNIHAPKGKLINIGTENEKEVNNDVKVIITFSDDSERSEVKVFGVPEENVKNTNYIQKANLLNSFLSYRELLKTYLMDEPKDKSEFKKKFAQLIIEKILANQINSGTQNIYSKDWDNLFKPRKWYKEDLLKKFDSGLKKDISTINFYLDSIIKKFDKNLSVEIVHIPSYIDYSYSSKKERTGLHPFCEIDLKVMTEGVDVENDEENHLTVLNEARLSALAISIYLSALIVTPQENIDFKILFLDDVFIGLDMTNRLPLLNILSEYKKPIQDLDLDKDGNYVLKIKEIDGVKQYESKPFFENYQVFITTYDRNWFYVAKGRFDIIAKDKWHSLELYSTREKNNRFNIPLIYNSLNDLEKSEFYFLKNDYPSSANYLRKALESRIKDLLPKNLHYHLNLDTESGLEVLQKLNSLSQFLDRFISYCEELKIDINELQELNNLKDWYFNPFSHDNIDTPIFSSELKNAIQLVKNLYSFEEKSILQAGEELNFIFQKNGVTSDYKIRLEENLRYFKTINKQAVTNVGIICIHWVRSGKIENTTAWGKTNLIRFINNKWKAFYQSDIPDDFDYIDFLKLNNGESLKILL
ncbi:MAG: AAA family ATPase [Bacteroidales bacterium]